MIPPLDERGLLPPGVYGATWVILSDYFAADARRQILVAAANRFAGEFLAHSYNGCPLYVAGSVLSDKPIPGDIEMTLKVNPDEVGLAATIEAIRLQGRHDEFKALFEIDFYISFDVPGQNDFSSFFQYVGEKTAALKHIQSKDKRGIVEIEQWTLG